MARKDTFLKAPIPKDEKQRLESLYNLKILDTPSEERFDRITKLATTLFKVPISTITLVDSKREWFKSCQGLSNKEGKRAISFCGHAVLAESEFIIKDAKKDSRFAQNPMVVGKPFIRFYAAIPLKSADNRRVGAFCIKDYKPRKFSEEQVNLLKTLANFAELELNFHELSEALEARRKAEEKLEELNEVLKLLNKILRHDLTNHLTVIKGNIDFLLRGKKQDTKSLIKAADDSLDLIKQIGHLESTVSSGNFLKPFQVRKIVEEVRDRYPLIKFNVKGEGTVLADEALVSVVDNIVRNAKMHGKTEKIDVEIKQKKNFVEVAFADFGSGIPKGIKNKVFTQGFKYGVTGNTGLGLYIVKRTISRYGGDIRIKDNKPKGAQFILKIPTPESNT